MGVEAPAHSVSNTLCTCEAREWARMWPQRVNALCCEVGVTVGCGESERYIGAAALLRPECIYIYIYSITLLKSPSPLVRDVRRKKKVKLKQNDFCRCQKMLPEKKICTIFLLSNAIRSWPDTFQASSAKKK